MKRKRKMSKWIGIYVYIVLVFQFTNATAGSDSYKIKSLRGTWKLQIGDDTNWKNINYNDEDWDNVFVPSSWEDQGYHGYDGYAWYRKEFAISEDYKNKSLVIKLGYIDDVDEVYINGQLIGYTGSFPPKYQTAYNASREYKIPKHLINYGGKNLIAVRVYDSEIQGGIVWGDVAIYVNPHPAPIDIDLEGIWKFHISDNLNWKDPYYQDDNWENIVVPGKWENQGYKEYDGYAWYRKKFKVPANYNYSRIVVLVGKIDDLDEVYLNGKLINPIKKLGDEGRWVETNNEDWSMFRAFYIDGSILKANQMNTIAVRVYDGGGGGGIYEGPVGIIDQTEYVKYWRDKKK
ncbi:sugar-binding domain-containing protein [Bacteroidota bacterium]